MTLPSEEGEMKIMTLVFLTLLLGELVPMTSGGWGRSDIN